MIAAPAYSDEFDRIMQQPPIVKIDACDEYVENGKKFNLCMLPYLKTADCRFRVKKSVYTEENKKALTEEELKEKFLELFHKCYVEKY